MDESLESELRRILEASPEQSYTLEDLKAKLQGRQSKAVDEDDLRTGLWKLFYQAFARPFTGEHRELRWKLMERQTNNLPKTVNLTSSLSEKKENYQTNRVPKVISKQNMWTTRKVDFCDYRPFSTGVAGNSPQRAGRAR